MSCKLSDMMPVGHFESYQQAEELALAFSLLDVPVQIHPNAVYHFVYVPLDVSGNTISLARLLARPIPDNRRHVWSKMVDSCLFVA